MSPLNYETFSTTNCGLNTQAVAALCIIEFKPCFLQTLKSKV